MKSTDIDVAIVGGGIVGFWLAFEILQTHRTLQVALFEKEMYPGEHTTGRNSEVLHAGIYYATGSLKHIHCIRGNQLWRNFAQEQDLPFLDSGKYIVATSEQEGKLANIHRQALANQVPGMRSATPPEMEGLKDYVHADLALYSPSSAVLDVSSSIKALQSNFEALGGLVFYRTAISEVRAQDGIMLFNANSDLIRSKYFINSAGLGAISLRKQLGLHDLEDFYVKGSYLSYAGQLPVQNLIYPIPPEDGLGLGVHLTLDISGRVKFGPNAQPLPNIDYSVDHETKAQMTPEIEKVFKGIDRGKLSIGYAGIRPKIKRNGEPLKDFTIQFPEDHGVDGYIELLGIESPGLTAAPSLARIVGQHIKI